MMRHLLLFFVLIIISQNEITYSFIMVQVTFHDIFLAGLRTMKRSVALQTYEYQLNNTVCRGEVLEP